MAFQNPCLRYLHKFLYILFHDKSSVFIGIKPSDLHIWYHSLGVVEARWPYQQPRLQEQNTAAHRSWNQVCGICKVNIPLSWLYLRVLILKWNWCSSCFFGAYCKLPKVCCLVLDNWWSQSTKLFPSLIKMMTMIK